MDFATLTLAADTTGLAKGEAALASLATTGARTEAQTSAAMERIGHSSGVLADKLRVAANAETIARTAAAQAAQDASDRVAAAAAARANAEQDAADAIARAARQEQAARQAAISAYSGLRASLDPVYAASMRYEQAIGTVNAAVKAQVITQADANRVLAMAEKQYLGIAPVATKAAAGVGGVTTEAASMGGAAVKSSGNLRMLGQQLSQVAQQGAITGNYLGALAVQLPDMALGFGNVAIAASIVATVAMTAMPAIIAAFGNGKTAAEGLADANDRLGDSLGALRSIADMTLAEMAKSYGEVTASVIALQAAQREQAITEANLAAADAVAAVADEYRVATGALNLFRITGTGAAKEIADELGMTKMQFLGFQQAIRDFETAKSFEDQAAALQRITGYLQGSTAAADEMTGAVVDAWDAMQKLSGAAPQSGWLSGAIGDAATLGDRLFGASRVSWRSSEGLSGFLSSAAGFAGDLGGALVSAAQSAGTAANNTAPIAGGLNAATGSAYGLANALSVAAGYMSSLRSMIDGISFSNIAMAATNTAILAGETQAAATAAGQLAEQRAKLAPMLGSEDAILRNHAQAELQTYEAALKTNVALQDQHAALVKAAAAAASAGSATSEAMEAAEDATKAAEEAAKDYADTMQGYVADGIDSVVNEMVGGFKGGLKGIANMLFDTIKRMIAFAIANPIKIAMGLIPGAALPTAAAAAPTGGILGSIGSAIGGIGSAFGSGLSSVWAGLGSGGLMGGLDAVGAALGGATAGLGGLATAIGAIALPVAAVAAVFSFFKTKTKILDTGFRITVDGMDALVESFKRVEKSRFWGLSKSRKTTYSQADADIADPIARIIRDMETSIIDAAGVLGIGADAFDDFAYQLKLSTKGMSEDEALQALQDKLAEMGDAFADMVPGLADLAKEGEGAMDAITRLSQSLSTVNVMADTLGLSFHAVGLSGADTASKLADAFGGLDVLGSATAAYYQAFYTEAERNATAIRQATAALDELGGHMPATRDEYRAMVSAMDLSTEAGRELFAALVGLSGVMDQVLPKIGAFSQAAADIAGRLDLGGMIDAVTEAQSDALSAADAWRDVAANLRDYIADLRGAASALISPAQALAFNEARFRSLMDRTLAGDRTAAGDLTGAADALLGSAADAARTTVEAALAQARVLAGLDQAAGAADTTAASLDTVAGLLGDQLTVLGEIRDFLNEGGDPAQLQAMLDRLTGAQADLGAVIAGGIDASLAGALADVQLPLETAIADLNTGIAELVAQMQADRVAAATLIAETIARLTQPEATPAEVPAETPQPTETAQIAADSGPTLGDLARVLGGGVAGNADIPLSTIAGIFGARHAAFAAGGDHAGGLRLVGENGPEIEATGPSRIFSADRTAQIMRDAMEPPVARVARVAELVPIRPEVVQPDPITASIVQPDPITANIVPFKGPKVAGNDWRSVKPPTISHKPTQDDLSAVVDELRALRKEVAELRDQSRQLDTQILNDGRRMRKIQEDWDANGMPAVRA